MLLHLLSEALKTDEVGKKFHKQPEDFCKIPEQEEHLFKCLHVILEDLILNLNAEFKEKGGEKFDFKKTYKSPQMIRALTDELVKDYHKLVNRGLIDSFAKLIENKS